MKEPLDDPLTQKFGTFLARAGACRTLVDGSQSRSPLSAGPSKRATSKKQVVLVEDLPNILEQKTQEAFHAALMAFLKGAPGPPLVIVISEASTRGEVRDERLTEGGKYSSMRDTIDIRTVIPSTIINGPFVTQIA